MGERFININFPFKDSLKGFFLDLNKTDKNAIKSDLMHIILTNKGERFYNPEFGTNLKRFIFEPNDGFTYAQIREEIVDVVKKYLPNLKINEVLIEQSTASEYAAIIRIDYTISQDVFETSDFVEIQI
jgi:phage baseplate assembly protein W